MKKKDNNDAQFVPTLQPFKGLKNKEKKTSLLDLEPKMFPNCIQELYDYKTAS